MLKHTKFLGLIFTLSIYAFFANAALAGVKNWQYEGWKTDFSKTTINLDEILSGGVPKDAIRSIDAPQFIDTSKVKALSDEEPVIGISISGIARAYPLRILMRHEIVNDTIDGVPLAITYCPLCNASIVFKRQIDDQILEFGTTGKLRNSDLVMYDRTTQSWWQQFTGNAIVGDMVGKRLKIVPSRLESFANFKRRFPKSQTLLPVRGTMEAYGRNPYVGYDTLNSPFLFRGKLPKDIAAMAYVALVRDGDETIAISLDKLSRDKTTVRGAITIKWVEGLTSVLDEQNITKGRPLGNVIVTKNGADFAYEVTFAFVVHAFLPDTVIEK